MEFAEGVQVTDLNYINDKKVDRITLSTKLGELYSHMIFKHGFVHSDPHPGNILIRKKENDNLEIVLLDHGLYAVSILIIIIIIISVDSHLIFPPSPPLPFFLFSL